MQEEQKSWKAFFKFKGRFFTNVENSYFLSGVEDMVAISGAYLLGMHAYICGRIGYGKIIGANILIRTIHHLLYR